MDDPFQQRERAVAPLAGFHVRVDRARGQACLQRVATGPPWLLGQLEVAGQHGGVCRAQLRQGFPRPQMQQAPAVVTEIDLVTALGGQALFLDATEHDGLMAGVEHLPAILAGALLKATTKSSGWQDMRKLAGSQFYTTTLLMSQDSKEAASACIANRENVVRWIDSLADELEEMREKVAEGDEEGLTELFEQGLTIRDRWLHAQASGNWNEEPATQLPTMASTFRGMIGLRGPADRKQKKGK